MRSNGDRKTLKEILRKSKDGSGPDSNEISQITQNLMLSRGISMLDPYCKDWDLMTCGSWFKFLCHAAKLPVKEYSYCFIVHRFAELAAKGELDTDCVMVLSSLSHVCGKTVKPYMKIPVAKLLKEAGLEDIYDMWFRRDTELYRELKGRDVTVGFVLLASFLMTHFCDDGAKPVSLDVLNKKPADTEEPLIPFKRMKREIEDPDREGVIAGYVIVWTWVLLVMAPLQILKKSADKGRKDQ